MEDKKIDLFYLKVMIKFLDKWFRESKCDCASVATLLSSMDLRWRRGQKPFDPALWHDWKDSIEEVLKKESDNK
jgi:hypothetical protein